MLWSREIDENKHVPLMSLLLRGVAYSNSIVVPSRERLAQEHCKSILADRSSMQWLTQNWYVLMTITHETPLLGIQSVMCKNVDIYHNDYTPRCWPIDASLLQWSRYPL